MAKILRWENVKTRKPHSCFGCDKKYLAGTEMVNAAYADSGSVFSCYWCATCEEYMRRHFEYGDETMQGEIYANDPEGWNDLKEELATEPERSEGQ